MRVSIDINTNEQETDIEKLARLMKDIDFCMLTTVSADGALVSRPMSANRNVDFNGDLWFFTYAHTHKVFEAKQNPEVNVSFADVKNQNYVSLSGTAELVKDKALMKTLWKPEYQAWFPEGVDTADLALLKVAAHRAEYWDSPNSVVSHAIALANIAMGQPVDVGENKKVDLDG